MVTGTVGFWIVSGVVFLFCAWALTAILRADSRAKFIRLFKVSPKAESEALISRAIYNAIKENREERDFTEKKIADVEQALYKVNRDNFSMVQQDLDSFYGELRKLEAAIRQEFKVAKKFHWNVQEVMESESLAEKGCQKETPLQTLGANKEKTVAHKITPLAGP